VDAGITQVALDAGAVSPAERARVLAELAEPTLERGVALDVVLDLAGAAPRASRAVIVVDELRRARIVPAVVSVRCPPVASLEAAREQAGALARIAGAVRGIPVMRRGLAGAEILHELTGGPVRIVEDGGVAEAAAEGALPPGLVLEGPGRRGEGRLERAAAALGGEGVDRLEARAYLETIGLLERLGLRGTAPRLARALERRLRADRR
jgi:hypothetical protein